MADKKLYSPLDFLNNQAKKLVLGNEFPMTTPGELAYNGVTEKVIARTASVEKTVLFEEDALEASDVAVTGNIYDLSNVFTNITNTQNDLLLWSDSINGYEAKKSFWKITLDSSTLTSLLANQWIEIANTGNSGSTFAILSVRAIINFNTTAYTNDSVLSVALIDNLNNPFFEHKGNIGFTNKNQSAIQTFKREAVETLNLSDISSPDKLYFKTDTAFLGGDSEIVIYIDALQTDFQ